MKFQAVARKKKKRERFRDRTAQDMDMGPFVQIY